MNPSNADADNDNSNSNVSKSSFRRRIPRRSSVVSKSSYQCDESLTPYIGDVIVDTELKNQVVNYDVDVEKTEIEVEANEPKNKKPYVPRRLSLYVEDNALNQVTTTTEMISKFPRVPCRVSSTVFIGDVVVD